MTSGTEDLSNWKPRLRLAGRLSLSVGLAFCLVGCSSNGGIGLTHRLWSTSDLRQFNEPAPNPNLALFDATNRADVLVLYDAFSEQSATTNRQAYFLEQNRDSVAEGTKPEFVEPAMSTGLKPIPVLTSRPAETNQPPQLRDYAVATDESRAFTLHRKDQPTETFRLPVYAETSGTAKRLALTPLAVLGDVMIVAAAVAVVAFVILAESGATFK